MPLFMADIFSFDSVRFWLWKTSAIKSQNMLPGQPSHSVTLVPLICSISTKQSLVCMIKKIGTSSYIMNTHTVCGCECVCFKVFGKKIIFHHKGYKTKFKWNSFKYYLTSKIVILFLMTTTKWEEKIYFHFHIYRNLGFFFWGGG